MLTNDLWELERRFWLEGASFYDAHLAAESLMIFPGIGIMARAAIIESVGQAPRWDTVDMADRQVLQSDNVVLLAYSARASKPGSEDYRAYCGSSYTRRGDDWLLLMHQQTPAR